MKTLLIYPPHLIVCGKIKDGTAQKGITTGLKNFIIVTAEREYGTRD